MVCEKTQDLSHESVSMDEVFTEQDCARSGCALSVDVLVSVRIVRSHAIMQVVIDIWGSSVSRNRTSCHWHPSH